MVCIRLWHTHPLKSARSCITHIPGYGIVINYWSIEVLLPEKCITQVVTVEASLRLKLLSHRQSCETSVHVSACEILMKWKLAHILSFAVWTCVCLRVFGGDGGRMFMLCHTLKCLVRTSQNRCPTLGAFLFTRLCLVCAPLLSCSSIYMKSHLISFILCASASVAHIFSFLKLSPCS